MSTFPAELTGTWDIDPVHSTVGFTAKHAMVATTRGHFTVFTGGATIDAANPDKLKKLSASIKRRKLEFHAISAVTGQGIDELKWALATRLRPVESQTPAETR